jgi:hypothetical protein
VGLMRPESIPAILYLASIPEEILSVYKKEKRVDAIFIQGCKELAVELRLEK